jgi:hypothetical protein
MDTETKDRAPRFAKKPEKSRSRSIDAFANPGQIDPRPLSRQDLLLSWIEHSRDRHRRMKLQTAILGYHRIR